MEPSEPRDTKDRLRRRIEAYHEAALAYAAVKLTIPETMGADAWTATHLADALDLSAPHLERLLRGLTTLGLVDVRSGDTVEDAYVLTEAGHALAPGAASGLREKLLIVIEQYWQPWAHLASSVTTGRPAFEHVFGKSVLEWRQSNAEHGDVFDAYLARETFTNAAPILERLDVTDAETVADLGGGHGGLLAAVLAKHAHLKGLLVDRTTALEPARAYLELAGVADRISFVTCDIRETVLPPANLYLLQGVLQQHDDDEARKILENIREALSPRARLVVIERLMPDHPPDARATDTRATDDPAAIMLDLHMMTITGGRVRTKSEMEALLRYAGLAVTAPSRTDDGLAIIEASAPE